MWWIRDPPGEDVSAPLLTLYRQGRVGLTRALSGRGSMSYLVEVPVGGGNGQPDVVKVQIEQIGDGLVQVARPGQVVARATRSMGEMLAGIRPVAQNFVDGFRGMAHAPDEICVEFGLALSAEADVVISSTAAQANFKVSLTWGGAHSDGSDPLAEPTA